jgi:LmbE family N-acetylglucosaminyl deacetylase
MRIFSKPLLIAVVAALLNGIPAPGHNLTQAVGAGANRAAGRAEDERGIVALDQVLRDLTNPFTVVAIAARPTDIDEGTLAFYRKNLGARVALLLVTRGEGEASSTRPELDQDLGVIRTREAIEVARMVGADVFFLNLRDFGYSRTAEDALRVWGYDEALKRMVRAIRSLRPDAIITSHSAESGDGIGRAVARLTSEAFDRAASASPPPEPGVEPWQTRRLFQKIDWTAGAVSQDITSVDLARLDRERGVTYAQIGLAARHRLLSSSGDRDRMTPDRERAFYRLIAYTPGDPAERRDSVMTSFLEGLVLPERVARSVEAPLLAARRIAESPVARDELINALAEKLSEKRAEGGAEQLHARYGVDFFRVLQFIQTLEHALALAIGVELEIRLSDQKVVPGQKVTARLTLTNHSQRAYPIVFRTPPALSGGGREAQKESEVIQAIPQGATERDFSYEVPADAPRTLPTGEHLREQEYYGLGTTLPGTQPAEPFGNSFLAFVDVGLGQVTIPLAAIARYDVARAVDVSTPGFALVKDWSTPRDVELPVRLRNNTPGPVNGALWIVQLAASDDNYEPLHLAFSREDEEVEISLKLKLPLLKPPVSPDILLEFRRERPHVAGASGQAVAVDTPAEVLGSARIAVKAIDAQVTQGTRVAYVRGRDAWLGDALMQLGVQSEEIGARTLTRTVHGNAGEPSQTVEGCRDLSGYDAIVIDELAYQSKPGLIEENRCLLRYARQGGNLVVLAQRPDDLLMMSSRSQLAPFPLTLSLERTAQENPMIKVLEEAHSLMTRPNKITLKDFELWTGERANWFPVAWANEYTALLEATGSKQTWKGLLLTARYGEGSFTYCALSLRRQILRFDAGAFRLLANLASAPRAKTQTSPQQERNQ